MSGAGSRSMACHIRADIDRLNATLKPKELEDTNEIIMWLTFGQEKQRVPPELMAATLQVKNKGASLFPLED
jgi:hypothetical protein